MPLVHISDTMFIVADVRGNGDWNLSKLAIILPQQIQEKITYVPVPSISENTDEIRWKASPDGVYSTSSS